MWIVGGTIPVSSDDPGRPYASCLIFDDSGHRVGRYDKIHLFDVAIPERDEYYRESANTRSGRKPVVISTPWGGLGCGVCYDLRFPEMFRLLSIEGMDFLVLPAAFTETTGHAHWHSIIRARAIENLCYVVAAAQVASRNPKAPSRHGRLQSGLATKTARLTSSTSPNDRTDRYNSSVRSGPCSLQKVRRRTIGSSRRAS